MAFRDDLHEQYGAPTTVWVNATAVTPRKLSLQYGVFEKTSTRLPESAYISFANSPDMPGASSWEVGLLEQWVSPLSTIDGASKSLSAVGEGIRLTRANGQRMTIRSVECGEVHWGREPTPMALPITGQPDLSAASFVLWANLANTNTIAWFPYTGTHANLTFSFEVELDGAGHGAR